MEKLLIFTLTLWEGKMEIFLDKLSWKLLLIAGPLALTIIVPGIYLIWQGVGK